MAIEKIKVLAAVLDLPIGQHCQSSQFTAKIGQMRWIGGAVWLVAPKRPPEFWFFELPWVQNLHFSWNPLLPQTPQKSWDNHSFLSGVDDGKFVHIMVSSISKKNLVKMTESTGSTIRIWHNVKTCLDQSLWQIYQKLMFSGFLRSGNLCLINELRLFWPHIASTASNRKDAKIQQEFLWFCEIIFFQNTKVWF